MAVGSLGPRFPSLIKAGPSLLVHDGRYPDAVLKTQKVARNEVAAALRQSGKSGIEGILSVVLETDGSMTVTPG